MARGGWHDSVPRHGGGAGARARKTRARRDGRAMRCGGRYRRHKTPRSAAQRQPARKAPPRASATARPPLARTHSARGSCGGRDRVAAVLPSARAAPRGAAGARSSTRRGWRMRERAARRARPPPPPPTPPPSRNELEQDEEGSIPPSAMAHAALQREAGAGGRGGGRGRGCARGRAARRPATLRAPRKPLVLVGHPSAAATAAAAAAAARRAAAAAAAAATAAAAAAAARRPAALLLLLPLACLSAAAAAAAADGPTAAAAAAAGLAMAPAERGRARGLARRRGGGGRATPRLPRALPRAQGAGAAHARVRRGG